MLPASIRERLRRLLRDNWGHVKLYSGFFSVLWILYMLFSDGDFSFLLTLSSLISLLSFVAVAYSIDATATAAGISLQTVYCYLVLLAARLCAIIPHQGYLPSDSSGDFLYQIVELVCLGTAVYVVYQCKYKFKDTYEASEDQLPAVYLLAPSFLLACFFHPSLNRSIITDTCWAFALYVETVAVLPQFLMFQKRDRIVASTAHFTAGQACAKILSFVFWLSTYRELNTKGYILKPFVGHWVIFTQFMQVLLVADFAFHYIKCITKGIPVEMIMADNV